MSLLSKLRRCQLLPFCCHRQTIIQQNRGCGSARSCGAPEPRGCVQLLILCQPWASKIVEVPRRVISIMFSDRESAKGVGFFLKGGHWILFFLWQVHCLRAYPISVESWNLSAGISPSAKGSTAERSVRYWDPRFSRPSQWDQRDPLSLPGRWDQRDPLPSPGRWDQVRLQQSHLLVPGASWQPRLQRHHWGAAASRFAEGTGAWPASGQEAV